MKGSSFFKSFIPDSEDNLLPSHINQIRSRLINQAIVIMAIMIVPAVLASLYRSHTIGWQPVMYLHIFLLFFFPLVAIFRKHLNLRIRAIFLFGSMLTGGIASLLTFGLIGGGIVTLAVVCLAASIFSGPVVGLILLFLIVVLIISVGLAVNSGIINFTFDNNVYATNLSSWINMVTVILLVVGAFMYIAGRFYRYLVKALDQSMRDEQLFRSVVNDQTEFMVRWKVDGVRTFVNDSYCQYYGTTPEQAIGTSFFTLISDRDREAVQARISSITPDNPVVSGEHEVIRPDGTKGWNFWTDRGFFNEEGVLIEYQSVGRDITEIKQYENALRKSEEKLSRAFEASPDGVAITRLGDGQIIYANPSIANLMQYPLEKVIGKSSLELGVWHRPEKRKQMMERLQRDKKIRNYEIELQASDGETRPISVSASLIELDGEICMVSLLRDISVQKRAERALQKIAEGVPRIAGGNYFNFVTDYLCDVLEVKYAFIGELISDDESSIKTKSVSSGGRILDNFEYGLKGTPCANVVGQHLCIYQDALLEKFPDDRLLTDMGVKSYAGGPIFNVGGKAIGIIVVMHDRPFKYIELIDLLLNVLGIRCAAEFDRMLSEEKLNRYQLQLRALATEITIAEEQERRRIAIELHDHIIQDLGLSKIKMGELIQRLAAEDCVTLARDTRKIIEQIIDESRTLVFELSLPILYELGFEAAINWLAEQTSEKLKIPCRVSDDGQQKPMSKEMQVLLFKAVRELMINIGKHAQAKTINIALSRINDRVSIKVQDDGIGFNPDIIGTYSGEALKFGLFGIRERLDRLNGSVIVDSRPGNGTTITLCAALTN